MEVVFTWKLGNRILRNNSRTRIYRIGPKRSKFVIKKAVNRDTGNYKCQVDGTKDRRDTKRQYIVVSGRKNTSHFLHFISKVESILLL